MSWYRINRGSRSEQLARQLTTDPSYRVLRKLPQWTDIWCRSMPVAETMSTTVLGIVDVETTGLDASRHQVIEIAIGALTICDRTGDIVDVSPPQSWLEEPTRPLDEQIEQLTGICDADLKGKRFDEDKILSTLDGCDALVAHNAFFDRQFVTKRFPSVRHPWGCSANDVRWSDHGLGGGKSLGALVTAAGFFMPQAHRAAADAWATTCVLMMPGYDGRAVAAHLIERGRRPTYRLFAEKAPMSTKDTLKAADYKWHPTRRCWWTEGEPETIANEAAWLSSLHPLITPIVERVDWYERWK